ncbi:uncharacterized protein PAC_17125 [Phialocephala subalpina]|uniref:Uncharacterized protein n=1 Tax=Phialocephala subalpina TaxID=576137 RepID=A0A1L7XQB0_9HELO|nr:uncharacterized protein PAC_17125 [Phialocephala subalpina]
MNQTTPAVSRRLRKRLKSTKETNQISRACHQWNKTTPHTFPRRLDLLQISCGPLQELNNASCCSATPLAEPLPGGYPSLANGLGGLDTAFVPRSPTEIPTPKPTFAPELNPEDEEDEDEESAAEVFAEGPVVCVDESEEGDDVVLERLEVDEEEDPFVSFAAIWRVITAVSPIIADSGPWQISAQVFGLYGDTAQGPRTNVELFCPGLWHNLFERHVAFTPQHDCEPGQITLSG